MSTQSAAARTERSSASSSDRTVSLGDPVQFLPGVGPQRARALAQLGVTTAGDLLVYFPFRHDQFQPTLIRHLEPGQTVTVVGRVVRVRLSAGRGRQSVSATIVDNSAQCTARWFNSPYISDRICAGSVVRLSGKVGEYEREPQLVNPRLEVLEADAQPVDEQTGAFLEPVYHASADLPSSAISRLIRLNLDRLTPQVEELYPEAFITQRGLTPRRDAVVRMHRPANVLEGDAARKRLAYDELLAMQIVVGMARRRRRYVESSRPLRVSREIDRRIRRRLPFALTRGQEAAVREISTDLAADRPMHRLLQGDVGSGKTLVAIYAALVAIANRAQVAIMAPTELLAEQLFRNADRYLAGSRVRRALLTGAASASRRRQLRAEIAEGELDLVVGTQALVQDGVEFARLGLVIVDEQHRFGVRQRMTIRCKGPSPHYLVMTATPIPRTLAMTVFGDLDVTTVHGMPPGRSPIGTRIVLPRQIDAAWKLVRERVAAGEQAFIVYPLVEASDAVQLKAATQEAERLAAEEFAGIRVGLVHGQMRGDVRDRTMGDFIAGRTPILVATTVIEVGIDVPAATVMVIQHANRYGLSQLHQLRGRVGRGDRPAHCLLVADSAEDAMNARLGALVKESDGFRIAEEDLRLRGPGEVLGTRQHGLPELRVADLLTDVSLLNMAQRDAKSILENDPALASAEFRRLRESIWQRYGDRLELAATG